jgi:hypothetical protein
MDCLSAYLRISRAVMTEITIHPFPEQSYYLGCNTEQYNSTYV